MKTVDIKYLKRSSDGLDASALIPTDSRNIIDYPNTRLTYCENNYEFSMHANR